LAGSFPEATIVEDLHEAARAQFIQRQARRQRFLLRQRAAVDAADEVVEQALAGRGVVEDVADERGLAAFSMKLRRRSVAASRPSRKKE
jgi:hypothetical protein